MARESRRLTHAHAQRPQTLPSAERPPGGSASARRWRLASLTLCGAILIGVATWIRLHVTSNPMLSIPPVETAGLLPAVAQEIDEKQMAIVARPNHATAWGEYGLVLLAHGFRKEAGDCFARAEALEPENYQWSYYLGMTMGVWDAEVSRSAFARAVEKAPTRLSVRLRLAEWLFDLRQLEECERHVQQALQQDPDSARAQLLQARLLFQRGAEKESLEWAQRAASSPQGNRRDVHELLARIYQRLGDADAAAVEIERTEQLPPGVPVWDDPEMGFGAAYLRDASVLHTLAELSRARGDMEGCLQRLRQIVTSEPNNVIAKEKLAATLVELQQYDEAQQFLDEALAAQPHSADLLYLRGKVHLARGEHEAACARLQRAIEVKPDYEQAYTALGYIHIARQDPTAALAALREAIRLGPHGMDAYRLLGQALTMTGQYDEAIAQLQEALQLDPTDDAVRHQLIDTLCAADRQADALLQAREAVQQAQDPRPFREMLRQFKATSSPPASTIDSGKDE